MMTNPAHAQTVTPAATHVACVRDPHTATPRMVCERVSNRNTAQVKPAVKVAQVQPNQITELQFTDAESDEAIRLFNCDCPICINAVRQLHGAAPMAS